MKTMAQRVRAGIRFLDKRYGKEWRRKIDLAELDLMSMSSCPLGQTDHDYDSHKEALGLNDRDVYDLGFYAYRESKNGPAWDRLTTAWKKALKG